MLDPVTVLVLVAEVSITEPVLSLNVFPEEAGQTEVRELHILQQNKLNFPFPAFRPHFDVPSCFSLCRKK